MSVSILLDIDGVMVMKNPWKAQVFLSDGLADFIPDSVKALNYIIETSKVDTIVLCTSHRVKITNKNQWKKILKARGVLPVKKIEFVERINDNRLIEITNWVSNNPNRNYVILDDDIRLGAAAKEIKERVVKPLYVLDSQDAEQAVKVLGSKN